MTNAEKLEFHPSRDTSPLTLDQLSDAELLYLLEIEKRLAEAKTITYDNYPSAIGSHAGLFLDRQCLASAQERYARILLLDGGRGTGKTSLLLTLVRKWHSRLHSSQHLWTLQSNYDARLLELLGDKFEPREYALDFVRVVRILDFDPLPPGMPLLAGIVQALRPFAAMYDSFASRDGCETEDGRLLTLWQKLFRVAAVGWSDIPQSRGIIDQVLDREEQVADWLRIAEDWNSFIGELLYQGKCASGEKKLNENTVLVIMIDDVDLQVKRVQELLPALRLLYHPRVFFLIAADKSHMIDMLRMDFLGKQNDLIANRNVNQSDTSDARKMDHWASILAESAFQKVFPKRNQWKLGRLSILDFLAFPGLLRDLAAGDPAKDATVPTKSEEDKSFYNYLRDFTLRNDSHSIENKGVALVASNVGDVIYHFAHIARDMGLPGVMPYRAASQLRQYVMGLDQKRRPSEILARLISSDDSEATVLYDSERVDLPTTGELAALYRRGLTELAGSYNIVLSGRPDFVFNEPGKRPVLMSTEPETGFNFTGALIAKTLGDDKVYVDAGALRWDTYLSLAWTEWPILQASFSWTRYAHPTPARLLEQTHEWAVFFRGHDEAEGKFEAYAYAWVYYQRKWNGSNVDKLLSPRKLVSRPTPSDWEGLLDFSNEQEQQREKWLHRTLPLLARPELGFPPNVQRLLLRGVSAKDEKLLEELRESRRRAVTDAEVAAAMQRGEVLINLSKDIEATIATIDKIYRDGNDQNNPWREHVEKNGNLIEATASKGGV